MRQKIKSISPVSITMIAILLFVQILSNGFAQIPNISDEETLETDVEIPSLTSARNNHTGGNNTNSNCGNHSNLTDMMIWTSATTYTLGDAVNFGWDVNCTVIGNNYTIDTYIHDGTTGVYGGSTWFGWTAQWNPMQFSDYKSNFAVGSYCLNATLYEYGAFVDYENTCFTVVNGSSGGGGNNTGGNNTGGNNTGGNNTGGNNNDAHCLIVNNLTINSTYYVTIDLENTCSKDIYYPGINATADHSGVSGFSNQTSWWYLIYANGTYNMSWQLSFDSSVQNGTNITLDFEAAILNCGANGTWHDCPSSNNSSLSYQFQYIDPPKSIVIYSASLDSDNDRITLRYYSVNYSGTVIWEYNSTNGTSTSSSYIDSYTRTTYIYPSTFGIIQICGTIGNSATDCVSVNRVSRMVEGQLISPSNNSQYSTSYLYVTFSASNYSSGVITLDGANYNYLGSSFEPIGGNGSENSTSGNGSAMNNSSSSVIYIPYGYSTICLELTGEDGTQLSDCITVERLVPPHSVLITYPATGASFTGQQLNLSYILENSSSHYLTIDGTTISASNNYSTTALITVGYGTHNVCIVSYDMANQIDSDCVTVNMIDPNADSDSDGIPDHSDLCPSTPPNQSVNVDGCSTSQLDSDSDGVADNVDICPATQQFSTVNSVGCSALQRDSDGDGVMDNLDVCPSTPVNSVVDIHGCANTQIDSDHDGVVDAFDICPNTVVGSQVNANGCASSQLDSDSDGIADSFDLCPSTSIGTVVDQTGCSYSTGGNSSGNNSGSTSGGSGSSGSSGNGIPSVGVVGTIAAISAGFIFTIRREDEE